MAPRLELQALLVEVLGDSHVYFQPPANVQMTYPCIVYQRDTAHTEFAENKPYRYTKRYQVTVISQDPDEPACDKVAMLPTCTHSQSFVVDNLHHDIFNIYF